MTKKITEKTLSDLEFSTVLSMIEEHCVSELGRERVRSIRPIGRLLEMKSELMQVNEYLASFENENRIPGHYFEDISKEIQLLGIEDSFLEGTAFNKISSISSTVNDLLGFFDKFREYHPTLFEESQVLERTREPQKKIERIVSPHGEVLDKSSDALLSIRKQIASIRGKLGGSFNKSLGHYASLGYLDDIRESVVDNQRVLAVLAMHRKKVRGAILGNSKTGSIVYIAPESTLQLTRELQNMKYEEKEEVVKILKALTDDLRPYRNLLTRYLDYLIHLDSIGARAKYARSIGACLPKITKEKRIFLREAYHPILWMENKAKKRKTIPQTLELNPEQQIIVISGPNAGGKSITLKTVGLLQVMVQSGILIPVHERSELCVFDKVLTDIGDNQSIENQLSTYSYRLKNMRDFLKACNDKTLFLIDEFGTGSDPELGGALAEVFLEEFYDKGAFGIITTHYSNLKVLANELEHATNANMQFDQSSLEPMYQLNTGQAGSSFTFEVAQKNGIPFSLINRAKKKVEREKIRLDKTIASLQKERNQLRRKSDLLEKQQLESKEGLEELLSQQKKIQERIESFQTLYDTNQKMLSFGRKTHELFNRFFQTGNKKQLISEFSKWSLIEKTRFEEKKRERMEAELLKKNDEKERPLSKRERTRINRQLKLEEEKKKKALKEIEKEVIPEVEKVREEKKKIKREKALVIEGYTFRINDIVRLREGNAKGTIEKIEKNIATINYGLFTAKTDLDQLELVKKGN